MKQLFPQLPINPNELRETCLKAKMTTPPLNIVKNRSRSENILEIIHSDLKEFPVRSFLYEKYAPTFTDEATHFTNVFILKKKSETLSCFQDYLNRTCKLYNHPGISQLYCDNGGEY